MPTVTAVQRPQVQGQTEDSYRAPTKHIVAAPTGMNIEKVVNTPPDKSGQVDTAGDTKGQEAVTLSPKLSAFAREEAKLRTQQQAFKDEKAKFEKDKADVEAFAKAKERLIAKDYSVLDELGVSYEEWTNHLLSKADANKPELQAIQELKEEVKNIKTSHEQQVNKQYEATVNQYRADIKALVSKDPEFITIKEQGKEEYVVKHILETFEQDGEVLTIEQASKEIEDALLEEALSVTNLTKVKAKIAPSPVEKKTLPPPKSGLRTLTNNVAPTQERKFPQMQHLSMKERLALAVQKSQKT